jgi:hypothetical protein
MDHFTIGQFLGLMFFVWFVIVFGIGMLFAPRPKRPSNETPTHDLDIFAPPESPPCP